LGQNPGDEIDIMADGLENIIPLKKAEPGLRVVERGDGPLSTWSDEALMLEHGQGSEDAYALLVQRHQRGVLNYVYRMVQNRHIAEELTQDVFLALVRNGGRYQPTAKFTTYLYTIASNIVSKEWARRKRRPKLFSISSWWNQEDDEAFNPMDHVGDERANVLAAFQRGEISEAVNEALRHLPEHQRETFVLRRFQDLSYEEIAEVLEVPVGTIKSRIVRAERALRPYLEKYREYL